MWSKFPYGSMKDKRVTRITMKHYGNKLCRIADKQGHLTPHYYQGGEFPYVCMAGGYHHITNLDMYRQENISSFWLI